MKCPNCGKEIEEGHLICEECGNEIQIVPDFEPEIENSITEPLSTLAALQDDEQTGEDGSQDIQGEGSGKPEIEEDEESRIEEIAKRSHKIGVMIAIVIVLFFAVLSYHFYSRYVDTVEYKVNKAKEYAANGEYTRAIEYLDSAYEKDDNKSQILFMKADYYYLMSDNESALRELKLVIDKGIYSYEDVEEAYDKMIAIYAREERYEEINELLLACNEDAIVTMFQGYMAKGPEFSYAEGDYDMVIPLKLSSNTAGTIYYTMDGSTPNKLSSIYTAPIFLENGDYEISAVFINDYGIKSEVVSKTYHISPEIPTAPEVNLYSGEYIKPMMIEVVELEGCSIYYTVDDSEPDNSSILYTGAIPMPLGTTYFRFINISEEGIASEITERVYTLKLQDAISTDAAVVILQEMLLRNGYLKDTEGHSVFQTGTYSYQFNSVLEIGDETYYAMYEYYNDGTGKLSRTDKVFIVQAYTGSVARLGYNVNGDFIAVEFGSLE
ncbi:MAG: chitobiase/beta-hexosaminidase C-terminal domain-containing protein [Lachnospiraceae bacterium]|nr:chitobiase/beta-hexosaminidase C-terminal domain-containing protein [Lachnospiraceae bacterium]